ncbi:hypothetical protein [Streptomyces sp. HNM0574]|uniref:hypothetical protein n=1 Tax=Streptomyces sp. HNM0574 TaxID=2714954 RepID=UPI00146A81CD|nr:hypothetical protein [Streptomyces sp. HNM0574]NLU66643.1 hypothetical protein [Streptomyces sp. HNM0574]
MIHKVRPVQVFAGEHQLTCPLCRNDAFLERPIKLNTTGMSFLNLDWANRDADGFICTECGRIEWFLNNGSLRVTKL